MRWLKRLGFMVLMLLLTLSLSLWALIKHPSISSWALLKVVQQQPGVSVEQISGNLWDGLMLSNLVVKHEGKVLVIEDAYIRWHWQALWQETFSIAHLQLGRVAVDLAAGADTTQAQSVDWQTLELPDLVIPIALHLQQATLHQLSVSLPDSSLIELSDLALSMQLKDHKLWLHHLSATMQSPITTQLSLSGQADLLAPHRLSLGLEADVFQPEWINAHLSLMLAGEAQSPVLHLDAVGDAIKIGSVLAHGDIWLNPQQACSPEMKPVTPLGQLSWFDVRADWSSELRLSATARVDAYQNRMQVRGDFLPNPELEVIINAVNLSHFNSLFPLSGKIQAQGEVSGDWQSPQGEVNLQAQGLAWKTHQLAQLSLKAKGDSQQLSAQLLATGISDAGKDSRVELRWQGALAQHQLNVSAKAWGASLSSELLGGLDDRWHWSGHIEQLQFIHPVAGLWQQQGKAPLTASRTEVNLHKALCLAQLSTNACITQAHWSVQQGTRLSATLNDLYLSRLSQWLPKTLKWDGKAQASASFSQDAHQRQGQLVMLLPASQFSYTTLTGQHSFEYDKVSLTAQLNNQQVDSQLSVLLKQGINLNAQARSNLGQWEKLDLQGKLNVEQLALAQSLMPDITGLSGRMTANFALSGSVNKPQLSAQVQLASVRLTPVVTGVEFSLPQLLLDVKPTGLVNIDGILGAGEGQASLKGWGNVADWSKWNMDLTVQGQNLLIAKTPQADIWLSPNIQFSLQPHQVDILGQLIVPKARLRTQSVGQKAIGLSDDVLLVGEAHSGNKMKIVPHMRVLLGKDVSITGSGLSAGLSGQLEITRSRLGNLLFQGEVTTQQGQFKAYQQDLTIEQGKILFNGVTDNPGLNVVASRKVLDETVGVTVTGSLAKPRLKVFSRPIMPDTDALSLLVLGKKTRDMTATDAAVLATKLATESDEDPLLQRLGQEAGLDVGLTNVKGEKNTGLSLGKRLSPDLYVRYIVGAFEYGARFITEYRINRLFSVEVQTGQYSGGDLFYRFEGD